MHGLPFALMAPLVLTVDWTNVSGGSIAIIAALFVIAGFFWRYAPSGSEARSILKDVNDTLRAENSTLHGERDSLLEAVESLREDVHQREKDTLEREKEIARLKAMPDTEQMLSVFETHHQENLALNQRTAETLERLVGMQGDLQALFQVAVGRQTRHADPGK